VDTPAIELLWWAGCPSTDRALAELREALDELGFEGTEVRTTELRTEEEARERGYLGSPTVLIDDRDPFTNGEEEIGLSCRVYRQRDGRVSPTPDPDDLREALRR
jgi:hypothetical protein